MNRVTIATAIMCVSMVALGFAARDIHELVLLEIAFIVGGVGVMIRITPWRWEQ